MDLNKILEGLRDCPCGKEHSFDTEVMEMGSGLVNEVGAILSQAKFPKRMLLVCDENSLKASEGILESLHAYDYFPEILKYSDLREANMTGVEAVQEKLKNLDGVLSVGTGSNNDICRFAAYRDGKDFAIFATAPSMDGFASDSAPIIHGGFKTTFHARQPRIIIADTKILADSPAELKSSGFGDMIAKMIGLVDWKISALTTGEYICDRIVDLTQKAVDQMIGLADAVTSDSEESAAAIMEALVFTGLAMMLAGSSRPGSGTEHIMSHFWECQMIVQGKLPDFHGKKVGVGTVIANRIYREMASHEQVFPTKEQPNWEKIKAVYGPLWEDVRKLNTPDTIVDSIDPEQLKKQWPEIRELVNSSLLPDDELISLMKRAGAATLPEEIGVAGQLLEDGIKFHPYMRRRITLMRLMPMLFQSESIN